MVSIEDAVIIRVSKDHNNFEILVDSDKALEFKKGKPIAIENIIAVQEIFKDAKKGERVSEKDLEEFFNTTDTLKVAEQIIKQGQLQLTTEQRRKFIEEKKKQIADIISKQGVDPKTKIPHPAARILNAMQEAHVNIDPFKPARNQVEEVLSKIRAVIPISIERVEIAIKIPIQYAGKASSFIRGTAPIKKEEWGTDAWIAVIEIAAGMQADMYDKLNNITSGNVEIKVIKRLEV